MSFAGHLNVATCMNGIDVLRNIPKAIHYFEKADSQGFPLAQFQLGIIYNFKNYGHFNISKAINYYERAGKNNYLMAYVNLGFLYIEGKYVTRDIRKGINYYQIAADLHFPMAQFNLGLQYFLGFFIKQDINLAFHYFKLSAGQNIPQAQFMLGLLYYKYKNDFNKAFTYFNTASCYNNIPKEQRYIVFNYVDRYGETKIYKQSVIFHTFSEQYAVENAYFAVGYLYQTGQGVAKNIKISIDYYKKASSFNINYAKNNLGIIYMNGCKEIGKNTSFAIIYLNEAINQKNDLLAMYNLSHLYLYDKNYKNNLDDAIELLIKSYKSGLKLSKKLLCIALVIKLNIFTKETLKNELKKYKSQQITDEIYEEINNLRLFKKRILEKHFEIYRANVYLYNPSYEFINSNIFFDKDKAEEENYAIDINSIFYDGFGKDIMN